MMDPVKGKLTLENGSVYEGELLNGIPHGKGGLYPNRCTQLSVGT